jgi:hypothetical protein
MILMGVKCSRLSVVTVNSNTGIHQAGEHTGIMLTKESSSVLKQMHTWWSMQERIGNHDTQQLTVECLHSGRAGMPLTPRASLGNLPQLSVIVSGTHIVVLREWC